uniref:Uncharacterized protein n=1 Tax=Tetranychus urticae TaxID=32264 RepID=T1JRY2_TETUR
MASTLGIRKTMAICKQQLKYPKM